MKRQFHAMSIKIKISTLLFLLLCCALTTVQAHNLVNVLPKIKPSVVGIGIYNPLASPRAHLEGTGFVVADGYHIVTNYHVVGRELDKKVKEKRVVFIGTGSTSNFLEATLVGFDELHDLALLRVDKKLPALALDKREYIQEGTEVAFTGFPIGAVLGLHPATHMGIISAKTPIIKPLENSKRLSAEMIRRLKEPYFIYQMDATAYPGNSGSAVYDLENGRVVGIINKVFVKGTKENVLSQPSGITYSIPVIYLKALLQRAGLEA